MSGFRIFNPQNASYQVASASCHCPKPKEPEHCQRLTCYTPDDQTHDGQVSLMIRPDLPKARMVTSQSLARLPTGAIIDRVEYSAFKGPFNSPTNFIIGLGQLNGPPVTPLIVEGTSAIANQGIGGAFDLICDNISGANSKPSITETLINFQAEGAKPISGTLRVDIFYHLRT